MFTADTYRVVLATMPDDPSVAPIELDLTVMWSDQLEAEELMPGLGISYDRPLAMMTVWCWCAAARVGRFAGPFEAFRDACLDLAKIATTPVDPTRPGLTG